MQFPDTMFYNNIFGNMFDLNDGLSTMNWLMEPRKHYKVYNNNNNNYKKPTRNGRIHTKQHQQPKSMVHQSALMKKQNSRNKPDMFKVNFDIDLQMFKPSEVSVKLNRNNNNLVVQAEHESTIGDGHHYQHHRYVESVKLPENVLLEQLQCTLDDEGHLKIEAPLNGSESSFVSKVQNAAQELELKGEKEKTEEEADSMETETINSEVVIEDIGPE